MNFRKLYDENADFKAYVDKYCIKHQIPVSEAIEHYLVQEAGRMYDEIARTRG